MRLLCAEADARRTGTLIEFGACYTRRVDAVEDGNGSKKQER